MKAQPEIVVIIGGPRTGKTLNQAALMRFYRCEECYDVYLYGSRGRAQLGKRLRRLAGRVSVPRVMIHTWDADYRNSEPILDLPNATYVPIEEARSALGEKWIEPIENYKPGVKTITIQIGNSDDKLSQAGWSEFCRGVQMQINTHGRHVHFSGGSDYYQPWQNACWVVEVEPEKVEALKAALILVRAAHRQKSIAWTEGETAFV